MKKVRQRKGFIPQRLYSYLLFALQGRNEKSRGAELLRYLQLCILRFPKANLFSLRLTRFAFGKGKGRDKGKQQVL
jgi:hypothetical protein